MKNFAKIYIAILFGLVVACTEPGIDPPAVSEDLIYADPKTMFFNGRFLEFATPVAFDLTLKSVNRVTDAKAIIKWGKQWGFQSARAILEEAVEKQSAFLQAASLNTVANPEAISHDKQLSVLPILAQNLELFRFNRDGLISGVRSFHLGSWALINKERLVKVGGNILQFNEESIKIIVGGSESKIPLLNKVIITDSALGIFVTPVLNQMTKRASGGRLNMELHDVLMAESPCATYTAFMHGDFVISTYSTPIFGPEIICECDDCEIPQRTKITSCYYPIIGYSSTTNYNLHSLSTRRFLGITWQSDALHWWYTKYRLDYGPEIVSSTIDWNCKNLWVTVYDGPGGDVSAQGIFSCGLNDCWNGAFNYPFHVYHE